MVRMDPDPRTRNHGKKEVAMSTELIDALESRVSNAVGTIEELRTEVRVLKEERMSLENKLRDLLKRMEDAENSVSTQASSPSEGINEAIAVAESSPELHSTGGGWNSSESEY